MHKRFSFITSMEEFFTKEAANEGIVIPLHLPTGGKSEHTITIYGVDSDEFYRALQIEKRKLSGIEIAANNLEGEDRLEYINDKQRESEYAVLGHLIKDWTFEMECTMENKIHFVKNAPQIGEQINNISGDRKLFLALGQES
jgi:hypothetical protein